MQMEGLRAGHPQSPLLRELSRNASLFCAGAGGVDEPGVQLEGGHLQHGRHPVGAVHRRGARPRSDAQGQVSRQDARHTAPRVLRRC